jgi:general secretion pathway protein H
MTPRARKSNGFTLIELLVVLAIMGLIATLALPLAARAVDDAALRTDARNLATRLSALQAQARGEQRTITVDPASLGSPNRSRNATITVPEHGDPLSFYPDGTSSGGTLRITERGRGFDLDVAWLTGKVTLRAAP